MPVPYFFCLLFQKIHFWKYPRNWTKNYGHFLFAKLEPEGGPGGPPRGQGRPLAAAPLGPVGGARPYSLGAALAPLDAYKILITLISSRR